MSAPTGPRVLLGCYFPRSVELEGVGSLLSGVAQNMAVQGWRVNLLLPAGTGWSMPGTEAEFYRPGLFGLRDYRRAIRRLSAGADGVLLIENNPNMVGSAGTSARPDTTFCLFLTPLLSLGVIREMGFCRQAILHAASKSRLLARLHDWSAARCIVATEYQAEQLRALGAPDVCVLPTSGISRGAVIPERSEARRRMGWKDGPVAGYLGHFSRAKGLEVLLEAFLRVPSGLRLALAHSGKGRLARNGRRILERLRREDRLYEHGVVNPTDFLAACDVSVLPYVTSSIFHLPQVMLESFAASTAVVTTDVGGIAEMLGTGAVGLVVPPRDPAALGKAMSQLLGDRDLAHGMGHAARQLFEERLCSEVFVRRFGELMLAPGAPSRQKRDAWAERPGTETYINEMGAYAVARDSEITRAMLGPGPGLLLDLPCGTGRNFELARELGFSPVGADYSPTMMRVAKQHQRMPLVRADAFAPPFARGAFAAILVPRLLFHYANPEAIIASLLPSLKPGGHMVFDTLSPFSLRWLVSLLLRPFRRKPAQRLYFEGHGAFRNKLARLGLRVSESRSAYVLPTRAYRFLPGILVRLVHAMESVVPGRLRVLTFWRVTRSQAAGRQP